MKSVLASFLGFVGMLLFICADWCLDLAERLDPEMDIEP
jgi:hypothetical protein